MEKKLKEEFLSQWAKYFKDSPLPIAFFFADEPGNVEVADPGKEWSCIICELAQVRKGKSLAWNEPVTRCGGARRFLGFTDGLRPNFEYFLSCGIPEKMQGERYIRTPEMAKEFIKKHLPIPSKGKYIIFKRWDLLEESDEPEAVIFFATPDVLSGLFTLSIFDEPDGNGVIAPFGSGCSATIYHPYHQNHSENPKAILGMFDPSARPCVPKDTLSFTIPMRKFEKIIGYMDETFLITETWETVKKRLG
jgi:uncharacterized protein (DUF169 family)